MGFLVFEVSAMPGMSVPSGGFSVTDVECFTLVAQVAASGNVTAADVSWGLEHIPYLTGRFPKLAGAVNRGWGLLTITGAVRPALVTLSQLFHHATEADMHKSGI